MAGGPALSSAPDSPKVAELDQALDKIGVTRSHHTIIFLILIGCLFDSFEQNAVGIITPAQSLLPGVQTQSRARPTNQALTLYPPTELEKIARAGDPTAQFVGRIMSEAAPR